jgi:hypothetical protein
MGIVADGLKAQREKYVFDMSQLRQALKDVDTALASLEGKPVAVRSADSRQSNRITLKEGVLLALDGVSLSIDEVLASVKGDLLIETTKASIASTMSRLKTDGLVQKVGDTDKWTKAPEAEAFAKDGTQGVSAPNVPVAEVVDDDL